MKKAPSKFNGIAGKITVQAAERTEPVGGEETHGTYDYTNRVIQVEKGLPERHERLVLYHEWTHSVLADTGLANLFTKEQQEAICDAVGLARMIEDLG